MQIFHFSDLAAIWTTIAFAMLGDTKRAWEFFTMLNPVNHGRTPAEFERYKVEPYVMCADIYGARRTSRHIHSADRRPPGSRI